MRELLVPKEQLPKASSLKASFQRLRKLDRNTKLIKANGLILPTLHFRILWLIHKNRLSVKNSHITKVRGINNLRPANRKVKGKGLNMLTAITLTSLTRT